MKPESSAADSFLRAVAETPGDVLAKAPPEGPVPAGFVVDGRFCLEALVASGGMGAVYRARDLLADGPVAVKILTSFGRLREERFRREATLLAELSHPTIVRHVSHGVLADGRFYIAMEWLQGQDLARVLSRSRLTVAQSLALLRQVADALQVAHARGVIHRDVKPSNIFCLDGDPAHVKLLDFGVAHCLARPGLAASSRSVVGTCGYMAPEQARAVPDIDVRVDVFALGCVAFECLTGTAALPGLRDPAVPAEALGREPPRVRELRADVPGALDGLVSRMLSEDRDARPADAGAVLRALLDMDEFGVAAARSPPVASLTDEERHIFSVVFIPGAELGEARRQRLREVATGRGLDSTLLGDGLLLTSMGGTGLASDRAIRAVACALALQVELHFPIIAVATGHSTGAGPHGRQAVVEQAARLALGAGPQGIRLDQLSAELVGRRFELRVEASASLLVRERRTPDLFSAGVLLGKPTPCVGRDDELAFLEATFDGRANGGRARSVLVTAPAGIGKSRLCSELCRKVARREPAVRILLARSDLATAASPFTALRQLIVQSVGLGEADSPEAQFAKVQSFVAPHCAAADVEGTVEFLGEMLGLPPSEVASLELLAARADQRLMNHCLQRSVDTWLRAVSCAGPLLLVLEDLHDCDVASVAILERAIARHEAGAIMVLALARPEVHGRFPWLARAPGLRELRLPSLDRRAAQQLVHAVLGDRLESGERNSLVDCARGNAFYLEELIRWRAERGAGSLPDTLLALLQSRLERLAPLARRLLRAASIFGDGAREVGLAALTDQAPSDAAFACAIRELLDEEVLVVLSQGDASAERRFGFRHSLLRDAAYAMLTQAERVKGHALVGEWLEQTEAPDGYVVGDHFERGGLSHRAALWFARAARTLLDEAAADDALDMRLVLADGWWALGQEELARTTLREAAQSLLRIADRMPSAAERESFLAQNDRHRRIVARLREWGLPEDH